MDIHNHHWQRLFKRPPDDNTDLRLRYVLAGWERIFGCTVENCRVVAKKAHQTGRMHPLLMSESLRTQAAEWNTLLEKQPQ